MQKSLKTNLHANIQQVGVLHVNCISASSTIVFIVVIYFIGLFK